MSGPVGILGTPDRWLFGEWFGHPFDLGVMLTLLMTHNLFRLWQQQKLRSVVSSRASTLCQDAGLMEKWVLSLCHGVQWATGCGVIPEQALWSLSCSTPWLRQACVFLWSLNYLEGSPVSGALWEWHAFLLTCSYGSHSRATAIRYFWAISPLNAVCSKGIFLFWILICWWIIEISITFVSRFSRMETSKILNMQSFPVAFREGFA